MSIRCVTNLNTSTIHGSRQVLSSVLFVRQPQRPKPSTNLFSVNASGRLLCRKSGPDPESLPPSPFAVVLHPESGKVLEGNGVDGVLAIAEPWPGQMRTVYGDHARFETTYFETYKGNYFTGDGTVK